MNVCKAQEKAKFNGILTGIKEAQAQNVLLQHGKVFQISASFLTEVFFRIVTN